MGRRTLLALALAAPLAVSAGTIAASPQAGSQAPPGPAQPVSEALDMTADRLELDIEAKTAILTGHVKLSRAEMKVSCPRVDVRYDRVPHVTWARGSGGVVAEVKGVRAEAPEVEIDLPARTLDLRGGVRLTRGDGWLTAERASINMATAKVTLSDVKGSIPLPKPAP
jgi:lipopolysaccharide export system protein LptA